MRLQGDSIIVRPMMIARLFPLLFASALAALPARAEVVVFAAASLKEPLDALAAQHAETAVAYGGSGTLARQIIAGAPADIVVLANEQWMQALVDAGVLHAAAPAVIAGNRLVLAGQEGAGALPLTLPAITDALGEGRIATGFTSAVPVGIYARAALEHLGLWAELAPRLAEVDNARAATALVARGQTPLGIVYQTDLAFSDRLEARATFPAISHPPIVYLAALVADPSAEATAFYEALTGKAGQDALLAAGFQPPPEQTR